MLGNCRKLSEVWKRIEYLEWISLRLAGGEEEAHHTIPFSFFQSSGEAREPQSLVQPQQSSSLMLETHLHNDSQQEHPHWINQEVLSLNPCPMLALHFIRMFKCTEGMLSVLLLHQSNSSATQNMAGAHWRFPVNTHYAMKHLFVYFLMRVYTQTAGFGLIGWPDSCLLKRKCVGFLLMTSSPA